MQMCVLEVNCVCEFIGLLIWFCVCGVTVKPRLHTSIDDVELLR